MNARNPTMRSAPITQGWRTRRITIAALALLFGVLLCGVAKAATKGELIARYLEASGRSEMATGLKSSLESRRALPAAGASDSSRLSEAASTAGLWTPFGGLNNGCNGPILAVATLPNGNLVVGGIFTSCMDTLATNVARWDGSAWHSLGSGVGGPEGAVFALAVRGNEVFAGGLFGIAGGTPANSVARWDGSSWTSLGTGLENGVGGLVLSLATIGGDLYVGGYIDRAGSQLVANIARWNGGSWQGVGTGIGQDGDAVFALTAIGSDLYAAGYFDRAGDAPANSVARWNGSAWSSLGEGATNAMPDAYVLALAVLGSDLYAAGDFFVAGGLAADNVARWNGSSWSSLGSGTANGTDGEVDALRAWNGSLYVGGIFNQAGGAPAAHVARWNGSAWSSLGAGVGSGTVVDVAAMGAIGDELFVGGGFTQAGAAPANSMARWNGSSWSALGNGTGNGVNGVVYGTAEAAGMLYAGGTFTQVGRVAANRIARWNGTAWSALGAGLGDEATDSVYAIATMGNDVYAGGQFLRAGGTIVNGIARWNGSSWSPLGSGVNGAVLDLAVMGGELYAGGIFSQAGGVAVNNLARWNGSTWSSVGTGAENGVPGGVVLALRVVGTSLYVGGEISRAGSVPVVGVAKWDGTAWSSLGSGVSGGGRVVSDFAVSGNDLYVGGSFERAGAAAARNVARWDGSTWSGLGTGIGGMTNALIEAIAIADGDLYVGGLFSDAGGVAANHVARWNGTAWSSLDSGIGAGAQVSFVSSLRPVGNRLYVGGGFATAGGALSNGIASVALPPGAGTTVTPQTGWYWNPAEGGRGFFLEQQDQFLFMAGFHYDTPGNAIWFVGQGPTSNSSFASPMYMFQNGQTLTGAYVAPQAATSPGNLVLDFLTPATTRMTWPGGTVALERLAFSGASGVVPAQAGAPESGWWWYAQESGRGFSIEFQGDALFATGYMYAANGLPIWYVTTGRMTTPRSYSGTWLEFRGGQAMGAPYQPNQRVSPDPGPVSFEFSDARNGTVTLPDGRRVAITRLDF